MGRSRRDAHLHALNNSPRAGYLHCPSGLKAAARRANDIAQEVQAENELLMTEAELHQAIEEVLAAKMHDLEEKHQHLQAAHRQLRLDNESLEAVIEQCNLAVTIARRDVHRLEAQLRKFQRRPLLTRKQRQQLQILKQTGVSIEVLRRWADSNCSRLDTHGRPGGSTVQPTPRPSPPEPTPGPSPPEPCGLFIPTQEASPGQPAARTAAYTAQQYLSTARLMLKTQVSRRRLSTCRRLFITEQCVVANTHRPGERTTVSRQLRVVYKYLRQRTLALGSSDTTTRWEAAQEVVNHAEMMQQQQEDQQQQQGVEGQQQKRTRQRLPMCDPRVWDAHGTWEKHEKQICAMADMQELSEQDQQQLQSHLEVYYLACPISNAPVESLLQLLKHGTGMFMELPALLELMSMRTHIDAIGGVDVLDFAQRLPELRKEVRREEAAAAMARRIAKAEMKAAAATHRVGQVVVDVGDHEGQHRLSAAYALTYDGRDYSHTTVEEAEKLSVRELQAYLRFHQQELMKGWLKPKLKGLVMAHIRNTLTGLHGDEQEAGYGPTSLMPKSEGGKETPGSQSSAMATLPYISPPILVLNASTSFVEWKGNAQGALMMAGCWSAMCGTDSDPARNERAYAWLLCCCKGHYLSMVQAAKTAPAAWKALLADQQRTGFSHCSELWHQINHLQLGSGESISQLCSRLSDLVLELAEADETVSEAVQVRALLQAVPSLPPYDMAREFITQGADASAPSLADVKRSLQNAEARVRNQQPAQLAAIHAPRRSSASPASSSSRHSAAKQGADPFSSSPSPTALSRVKCFKCGKRGHIARDCKEPGSSSSSSSSGSSSGGGGGAAGGGAGGGGGAPGNRGADKGRAASSATAGLFHAKLMAMQAVPSSGASGSKGGAVHNGAAGGGAGGEVQCCWSHAAGLSSLYPCVSSKPTPSLAAAAQVAAMPRSSGLLSSERFWLADSGASHHITPDRSLLHDFQAVEQPVSLALGKNTARLVAHGVGNVRLVSESGQCFTLRGVLWAPDAAANYLSTVVADLAGWRVVQEGGGIRIEDRANPARFCVKGALVGRSYLIRCSAEPAVVGCEPPATAHAVTAETPQLLHERLGHLSYGAMADLIGKGMVSGVSISAAQCKAAGSGVCPGCAAGKMHRRVADTLPSLAPPVKGVLDLVHTDVCGPFHVASVGGYSYVVTFLDEYSGLSLVECVKAKSDVPGVIISTVQWLETQSGRKLKALRSDNGTEYINQEVKAFLASKGIQHQRSAPYSPEQNGSAERLNRTLIEKVRCMLYTAGLPTRLWTEAVRTANHLRNLSPMRGKGATPWELFFGVKPDISALRVFGATAYAHVPQHMRSKLEGKAVQGFLVGYEMGSKAYRVLVPGGRIIVTKDVVFDELARGEPLPVSEVAEVMATAEELSVHTPAAEPSPEPAAGGAGGEAVGADSSGTDSGAGSAASAGGGEASASAAEPAACPVPLRQSLRLQGVPPAGSLAACVLQLPAAAVPILAEQWAVATDAEMESLHGHRTWKLVDPPQGCRPLDNRWVFSVKEASQGHIARLKARLVVKGFMQREGVDFTELHAPVSKHATVRALLATAAAWDMDLEHLDVKTAFLNGYLDEEIYMKQPAGYEDGSARVCRLKRALYGLRQAPRAWHARLKAELEQLGFAASAADSCLFTMVRGDSKVLLAVYVDDCLLAVSKGDAETMAWVKQQLAAVFDIHQLGSAERFLGMEIVRDRAAGRLVLSQERYAAAVVDRFGLADARPRATPLSTSEQLVREGEVVLRMGEHSYAKLVGSLMHLAVCTRPDIAHAVGLCAKYMAAPTQQHWQALHGVLRYVASTVSHGLAFGGAEGLVGFCDADFAGDLDTRCSTTGFVFTMHGAAVSWSSRRQPTVAVSTTEAEYMAASAAAKEALWLRVLLADLSVGSAVEPVTIMCDNEAAITLIKHPIASARSKHIDVLHHFVRERVARGELVFKYLASGANVADAMTKALPGVKYEFCKSGMGMVKL
ncbi:hypothetical protein QJQ45_004864 [Haematococcus lacustris]|nr:hypothetical protein QJQ45_004864 [Haematococcus lacustris]